MGVAAETTTAQRRPSVGSSCVADPSAVQRFPMRQEDYNALAKLPGNDHCIDCGSSKDVEWASVSFGILFCVRCSYIHKQVVGAHFRCIKAGTPWTRDNLNRMKLGGNAAFKTYFHGKNIDFSMCSMHQRYTSPVAREYYAELKALVDEAKASVAVALKFPSVQEEKERDVQELVTARTSVGSSASASLDDSIELDEAMQSSNHNHNSSSSRPGKLYNALAKFSKSGRRLRSDTEETSVTSDASNPVPNRDETSVSEFDTDQEEDEDIIISRIVTRQSITAMDVSVSDCVRQCLEENKEEQSILYKWTAKKIAPSVSYMGRSFKVDGATGEVKLEKEKKNNDSSQHSLKGGEESKVEAEPSLPASPNTRPKMEASQGSFVNRMGFSWRTDSTDNENSERFDQEDDYTQLLRRISDTDFRKLKAALRSKGALTSMCMEEMIYTEAASACSLPKPKRSSFKSYFNEHSTPRRRSRWAPPPHHRHSMIDELTEFGEGSSKLEFDHEEFVNMNIMPLTITLTPPPKEEEKDA